MFDHKQDLLFDNFRPIVLTVGVDWIDGGHNSSSQILSASKLYLGLDTSWPHVIFDQDWTKIAKLTETIVRARYK
jgi:hypothetical protein